MRDTPTGGCRVFDYPSHYPDRGRRPIVGGQYLSSDGPKDQKPAEHCGYHRDCAVAPRRLWPARTAARDPRRHLNRHFACGGRPHGHYLAYRSLCRCGRDCVGH